MKITRATDPAMTSGACRDILNTLPGWFGQPEANAAYMSDIGDKVTFLAGEPAAPIGLLALDIHFETNAEIWLMAVRAGQHRQGIGRALIQSAGDEARGRGCKWLTVATLSPRSDDPGYAATRAFYTAMGFAPLLEYNRHDPLNPMMWMIRAL